MALLRKLGREAEAEKVEDIDPELVDYGDGTTALDILKPGKRKRGKETVKVGVSRLRGIGDEFESGKYAGQVRSRADLEKWGEDEEESDSGDDDPELLAALDAAGAKAWEGGLESDSDSTGSFRAGRKRSKEDVIALEEEDARALRLMRKSASADPARGRAVIRQIKSWDALVDMRIKCQKALDGANRIGELLKDAEQMNGDVRSNAKRARRAAAGLCADLMMVGKTWASHEGPLKARLEQADVEEGITDVQGDEEEALEGAGSCLLPHAHFAKGEKRLEATWSALECWWKHVLPWAETCVDDEFERVSLASLSGAQSLKALAAPPSRQVREVLMDEERVRRRAHLRNTSASKPQLLSTPQPKSSQWDENTYDDGDLLRSFVKEMVARNPNAATATITKKSNSSKKKYPSTRPSQRMSYAVQEPIVNFLAPKPIAKPTREIDALVRSVFQ